MKFADNPLGQYIKCLFGLLIYLTLIQKALKVSIYIYIYISLGLHAQKIGRQYFFLLFSSLFFFYAKRIWNTEAKSRQISVK